MRPTRLIPVNTRQSVVEEQHTSVLLSAMRLIKEFREDLFSPIKIKKNGTHLYYTELNFFGDKKNRPDGLIVHVVSKNIVDAILIEVKINGKDIEDEQIERYIEVAKNLGIEKILTISNQFVPDPSQSPVKIHKLPKNFQLFHFSWSYIQTIAQVLIHKNDHNIDDTDQEALMREIIAYLDHDATGVQGFTQMLPGWANTVKAFLQKTTITKDSEDVLQAVTSWQQEEKDMALILSKKLGLLVKVPSKQDIHVRYQKDIKNLLDNRILQTRLMIDRIVSPIEIEANFYDRTVSMSVTVESPDKTTRGKAGWIRKQLEICSLKDSMTWEDIGQDLHINFGIKYAKETFNRKVSDIDDVIDFCNSGDKKKEITGYKVVFLKDLGGRFGSRKDFITIIEKMLIDFYSGIVQYLANPPQPAPKVIQTEPVSIEG
ncbi:MULTISPECIES: hypothetical protein [unclassified Oceanispirochaeta]|uniref:hypothetical protein n=1 Tax=unclassified Oceanispirochaeta TaxID=2635722 RepID=UPI000E092F30|nr:MULTISPECIES: hypothetical protein [unclassified Oceanispirochaeta]MBF9018637.1 hypothetical protein [Oceanispirochaeta sp. M2]NPD75074.1 hypothetical protein [Oceanispirochaeta sp. M1]RDG29100.1 hypothetical protein DV872_23540 [Oceanispirochaeta sp. M1]